MSPLGWYLLTSLLFVFGALAEFAFALLLHRKEKSAICTVNNAAIKTNQKVECFRPIKQSTNDKISSTGTRRVEDIEKLEKYEGVARLRMCGTHLDAIVSMPLSTKIDILAFGSFNLLYLIFNLIYWSHFWKNEL